MDTTTDDGPFTREELEAQQVDPLPRRDLMAVVTLLGLPLASTSGIQVNVLGLALVR